MSGRTSLTLSHAASLLRGESPGIVAARLAPDLENLPHVPSGGAKFNRARAEALWREFGGDPDSRKTLLDDLSDDLAVYEGNIENGLGLIKMPVGLAGPLRVNGVSAKGDYPVPLATTEAALVASYHRGCRAITEAGGCSALVLYENLNRAPGFVFRTTAEACLFVVWAAERLEDFRRIVAGQTTHGELLDMACTVEGNHVYLNFDYRTGDASGQNMVTLATQAICDHIMECAAPTPERCYVESNLSGDKKASSRAFVSTRGKKVTAEVTLPRAIVTRRLRSTPEAMADYWRMSAIGGVLSGTMGIQGHFANGLTALYLATGQDAACVAESATGVTRFQVSESGDLYAAVTLPGVMVGTVGGGTRLPTQNACLRLMGLAGEGKARALAEVCAGLLLAGELSIIAALSAGHFSRAHKKLARR